MKRREGRENKQAKMILRLKVKYNNKQEIIRFFVSPELGKYWRLVKQVVLMSGYNLETKISVHVSHLHYL